MRHAHILGRKNTALVIVDLQEKFIPVIQNADEIVQNTLRCTLTFQMFSMPVLVTEQYPQGLGSTVAVIRNQFPVLDVQEKVEFSCLQNGDFRKKISEVKPQNVVLCGVESHVCIEQTALDLLAAGYAVYVVVDAVGARRSIDHATAIEKMKLLGIIPVTTEMVLFELAEKAGTQSFKNIQRMVKFKLKKSILEKGTEGAGEPEATPLEEDDATTAEKDAAEKDAAEDGDVFDVFRTGDEIKDPDSGKVVGVLVSHLGQIEVRSQSGGIYRGVVLNTFQELSKGDRLKPAKKIDTRITPSFPEGSLSGKVLYMRNNTTEAGQNQVIGINLGNGNGLQPGTALSVHRAGRVVKDAVTGNKVRLPEEKIGELLVLVSQSGGSLALVTKSTAAINIGDTVRNQADR